MSHESTVAHDYDAQRTRFLSEQGWRVFRIINADVFTRLDGVIDAIAVLVSKQSFPPPLAGGGVTGA